MARRCVCCGIAVQKSAQSDPYLCRGCEKVSGAGGWQRYRYINRKAGLV